MDYELMADELLRNGDLRTEIERQVDYGFAHLRNGHAMPCVVTNAQMLMHEYPARVMVRKWFEKRTEGHRYSRGAHKLVEIAIGKVIQERMSGGI